jgi:GT2 family glycosyltransferase
MNGNNRAPVTVIIVNYKTPDLTLRALTALFESDVLPAQVIVVDNNSGDDTLDQVRAKFPSVECIAHTENLGFAKANNDAMRHLAREKYIWLLNSDTETGRQTLRQLTHYMDLHPGIGAISPQLVYPDRTWQSVGGFFPTPFNVFRYLFPIMSFLPPSIRRRVHDLALYPQEISDDGLKLEYVTGAAMFLRRSALDAVGLLGEDYFMYFEETDLCWRLHTAGWLIEAVATDPVMHVYGGSFRRRYDQKRLQLFLASLVIFTRKYIPGWRGAVIRAEVALGGAISICLKTLFRQ